MTQKEYEQLFGRELASLPDFEGWKTYLLKGDRGDRMQPFCPNLTIGPTTS
jgi:hypothetical protein